MTSPNKIVLGASGYIGYRLFTAWGVEQAVGTHKATPCDGSVYFDPSQMNLRDLMPSENPFTHAIILFAETKIETCKRDEARSYALNVTSTKRVLEELLTMGVKPVFVSSAHVFSGEKGNYTEQDEPDPITVYGKQKLEVENYLAACTNDFATLRLNKVYGSSLGDQTLLADWVEQITQGSEIRCAYDEIFSPIHIDDVVNAMDAVIKMNLSGTFNLAGTETWSRLNMLKKLLGTLHATAKISECSINDFNFLDVRPLNLSMNPNKIIKATGLHFRTLSDSCTDLASKISGGLLPVSDQTHV